MSKLAIFDHFLSIGNLKPKLKWFFKPKLKPKIFLLNWAPGAQEEDEGRGEEEATPEGHDDQLRGFPVAFETAQGAVTWNYYIT